MPKKVEYFEGQPGPGATRSLTGRQQTTYSFEDDSDKAEIKAEFTRLFPGFAAELASVEQCAQDILRENGLPTDPLEAIPTDNKGSVKRAFKYYETELHSQPWFANQILIKATHIRQFLRENDAVGAATNGVELGRLLEQARFKVSFEADAVRGAGVIENTSKGGKVRAEQRKEETRKRNEAIIQEAVAKKRQNNTLKATDIAKILAPDAELAPDTVRKIIGPAVKKLGA